MSDLHTCDLLIIGAGPAGLSAAIQAKRLGIRLVLIERDRPGGQALAAHSIENYPGCPCGISGKQLMGRFIEHSQQLGIELARREVTAIDYTEGFYRVTTAEQPYSCKAVVVASGLAPEALAVQGADQLSGSRLFYYTDPSRFDLRNKRVLVIGGGDAAFDQAINFSERAASVTIAMRGATPRCLFLLTRRAERRGIRLMRSVVPSALSLDGDEVNASFTPAGGGRCAKTWSVKTDYVVACTGKSADLAMLQPLMKAKGRFPIKPGAVAKWPGLYFAGDICRGNTRQISIAAGDGMQAAMDIHTYLIETSTDEHPFVYG